MTSYRASHHELAMDAGGPGCCSPPGAPPAAPFRLANGTAAPHDPPRLSGPPPAVPKMGVRARIADWPPRRDPSRESLLSRDCAPENGPACRGPGARAVLARLPRRRSKDVEFHDGVPRSPAGRGFAPLRYRSSSEVTLSEHDGEPPEARLQGGALFREYGSTSSIDVQGVPDKSFFDMLNEFRQELPDQRSAAPEQLGDLLRADGKPQPPGAPLGLSARARKKSGGHDSSSSSIFRKLRSSSRGEVDGPGSRGPGPEPEEGRPPEPGKPWLCPRSFAHYDVQSLLFDLHEAAANRASVAQRRNTATGASAASAVPLAASRAAALGGLEPGFASTEELSCKENLEPDPGDSTSNQLLLSCPHFRNEVGGEGERSVSFQKSAGAAAGEGGAAAGFLEPAPHPRCTNASVSVLEVPAEQQTTRLERLQHYSIEHVDMGALYYQSWFHGKEHSNYFGTDEKLGPVAVSIRREKLEDTKDLKDQYQYRIIFRTSELVTLRGSILEDTIPSTTKHGTVRGLPLKDVLEYVVPELNAHCLRLALSTAKVTEQLIKLDEQGLSKKHKVGILLCRAAQSTEEEMYNNEEASPAFQTFLSLLGDRVCLKGFSKYAAQLDTKTDSTGTHSLYTCYQDYEVMFHVSTMLPYMPNNPQQLLRKRHIGNDIVTIVFQEPGALPFTPQNIRSHFQHVFIIVRVHNPGTESVCYSVAVTRMKDVPPFGPPIPCGVTFRNSEAFRDFLLAKVINAENAAHKSDKFHTMATRTRQEYLKDLAENCVTGTPLDSAGKFNLMSLASKKRERARAREGAELGSAGAVGWRVAAQDFGRAGEIDCVLAVSNEFVVLVDRATKEVVFNCFCADVIGWTPDRLALKIFYGRGDHVSVRVPEDRAQDIREVVQRLKVLTVGCETVDMTLRRNGLGQLGFHVKFDGTVAEVEEYGFAWQAGLRQGSRLVEICKVAVVTLSHDQMIDLLRTSVTVKVVIIPPYDEGGPRRGCTEEYEMKTMEQKPEPEPVPAGYRAPYRSPAWRWDSPPTHSAPQGQRWASPGLQPLSRSQKVVVPVPYREPQHVPSKRPVSFPENPYSISSGGAERAVPYRNSSGSFSTPGSGLGVPFSRFKPSPDRYGPPQRPLAYDPHAPLDLTSSGESSSGFTSQESTMERVKTEPMWHVPTSSRTPAAPGAGVVVKRPSRQDAPSRDSPNRHSKGEAQYSSHSSSNTLSSNASSNHSDERWFDPGDPAEAEPDPLAKGGSSDSGIDAATLYTPSPNSTGVKPGRPVPGMSQKALHSSATYSGLQELAGRAAERRRESSPAIASAVQTKGYRTKTFPPPSAPRDPFQSRSCYTPQGYKPPGAEMGRPTKAGQSGAYQLSTSAPKSLYSKSRSQASSWKRTEETGPPANPPATTSAADSKKQIDVNSKNVFGQPRLRASLRDLRSPRKTHKSTIEDDLKKLIIMDNPGADSTDRDGSPRKSLQRTFSDESICSGRRDPSYASSQLYESTAPNDLLFSSTLPLRRTHQPASHLPDKKSNISASELSLTEARDKTSLRRLDPGMMPLPDTACGLEWSSLVNAAKAYEVQKAVSLFSLNEPVALPDLRPDPSPVHFQAPPTPRTTPTIGEDISSDLSGRIHHLEVMLRQLNSDLEKEKQDKVALLVEVANLRENNQRLQEESQTASEQLKKFSQMFGRSAERK
ncbi:signal-induced proliferation-associated 1-like protein 3 [Lepisosteus oculatus]|uniref:signal-induced proliferation-associated 1-like protein 3 n=1 Tax=Lepisosteus oculatus TaxID=7918 RepID=UPI0037115F26